MSNARQLLYSQRIHAEQKLLQCPEELRSLRNEHELHLNIYLKHAPSGSGPFWRLPWCLRKGSKPKDLSLADHLKSPHVWIGFRATLQPTGKDLCTWRVSVFFQIQVFASKLFIPPAPRQRHLEGGEGRQGRRRAAPADGGAQQPPKGGRRWPRPQNRAMDAPRDETLRVAIGFVSLMPPMLSIANSLFSV